MPQVEARVDLEQVPAARARVLLEVHLEDALQGQPRGDVAAEREQLLVVVELDERALAGERRIGAELAAEEGVQHVAVLVRDAMEGPQAAVVAAHVFLEEELLAEKRDGRIGERVRAAFEDARLGVAVEEAAAQRRLVPVGLDARLHQHGTGRGGDGARAVSFPVEGLRHRQPAGSRQRFEPVLLEKRLADMRIVHEEKEIALQSLALRVDQLEGIVAAVHEGHAPAVFPGEAPADGDDRFGRGFTRLERRNEVALGAEARGECRLLGIGHRDHRRNPRETERANQVHSTEKDDGKAAVGKCGHGSRAM